MNEHKPSTGKPAPNDGAPSASAAADAAAAEFDAAFAAPGFDPAAFDLETRAVRAGFERTGYGEHSEPMFLTSSFVHTSAANAAAKFSNEIDGYIYSRFRNPTVRLFQDRLAALEGAEACLATASGMSAIQSVIMSLTRNGDHIVSSMGVFGTTVQLFGLFERYGVRTSYVPLTDLAAWEAAIEPSTRFLFLETPANPSTEVADLESIAALARRRGVQLVVDNCFCTPVLQRPLELGADIIVHSATKYLDGQGRVLGGAVLGRKDYVKEKLEPVLRFGGPTMSAFNAWVLAKGLETLPLEDAAAVGQRPRSRAMARTAAAGRARALPGAPQPPPARDRVTPAERRRPGALLRGERRGPGGSEGQCLEGGGQLPPAVDHRQSRRREDDHHPSRQYDAWTDGARRSRSRRHHRRLAADRGGAGVAEGRLRRPAAGPADRLRTGPPPRL